MCVLLFFLYMASDYLYTVWMLYVAKKKAVKAALSSGAIYILSSVGVISYVDNHWYLAPTVLGAGVGTYLATKFSKGETGVK